MELLVNTLAKLKLAANEIEQPLLQEIFNAVRKPCSSKEYLQVYNEIVDELWKHLRKSYVDFDNQLLCASSFFTVLFKSEKNEFYLSEIVKVVDEAIAKESYGQKETEISRALSLLYGLFQSSYLSNPMDKQYSILENLLKSSFHLLTDMAYEYSIYTFIVFKTMTSFKKVVNTHMKEIIFNRENQIILLNVVNHNWENPITGVRNLNRNVFQTLITVLDSNMYNSVLLEINSFYWNKAKFLMVTEIIEVYDGDIGIFVTKNMWVEGLISSLNSPALVSAGADMYFAVLKKLNSDVSWVSIFLDYIVNILSGKSKKSIENFSNYWCLTTFKKFPQLFNILLEEVTKKEDFNYKLYSLLCLMKQGNKLGLLNKKWHNSGQDKIEITILNCLDHIDPYVRMLAFETICVSFEKSFPTQVEYDNILLFLWNNLNSDCTVLRLSMLNSLGSFMLKLHATFINNLNEELQDKHTEPLKAFCVNLQDLIKDSLNLDGNYQRRITTVKILDIVLQNSRGIPRKKEKQFKKSVTSLYNYLNDNGKWVLHTDTFLMKLITLLKDPANDVHENVGQILLKYYLDELCKPHKVNFLLDDAMKCLSGKFFFEISCGQLMFKLVINIILTTKVEGRFRSVEDIFFYAYNELSDNYMKNTLELIENGKQLHSFISILNVTLDACIQHTYKIDISSNEVSNLLTIMDCLSNQFAWEKEPSMSSDFSEMSVMVESIIKSAGYNPSNEEDQTKISGLHQLVLNSLWLNLKSSCELASLIIKYNPEGLQTNRQCLNMITNVLETSRHKGAIEAAGTALGNSINCLTSQSVKSSTSDLSFILLEKKLNEMIFEANKTSSVTRRGAGLSIMVHKIVSNDMQKGKPLFHYFMKVLLSVCRTIEKSTNDKNSVEENEKDLPKAIYIHFLTKIIIDSSLSSDIMFYATELAELVFENLNDTHWQIRNAALQLYGALIPKLIGQKKSSYPGEETIATVACDEFRTHFPKVWTYIMKRLKVQDSSNDIQSHSNLVPILNILANIAKRYNFSYNSKEFDIDEISLLELLGSPIYVVRRLTANAITNLGLFNILDHFLNSNNSVLENLFHGITLLMINYRNPHYNIKLEKYLEDIVKNFMAMKRHSFLSQMSYEKIFSESELITVEYVQNTLTKLHENRFSPGAFHWADCRIQNCVKNSSWDIIPEIFKLVLQFNGLEQCLEILLLRLESENTATEETLIELAHILLASNKTYTSCDIWKSLYYISLRVSLYKYIDSNIFEVYIQKSYLNKIRYIIPLASRILVQKENNCKLLQLSENLCKLSNADYADVDIRSVTAIANNEFAHNFSSLADNIKLNAIKSTVILLQDEDEDIRNSATHFYQYLKNDKEPIHPYICLNKIMNISFMQSIFNDFYSNVEVISADLFQLIESLTTCHNFSNNPFANDSKNIYMEVNLLKQLVENLINK